LFWTVTGSKEELPVKVALLFPGQGAQYVGMGRELIENYEVARRTLEEADDALGFALSKLILEGPEEELRLTYHTQPALLTVSIAAYRVLAEFMPNLKPAVAAGHSLGEYSALVALSSLSFSDAVKLVHLRGQWMDEAVPAGQGAMSAVLGMGADALDAVCRQAAKEAGVVELANINCPGQIVISGTVAGVERASTLATEAGARRVIPLVVSGPFHCSLMKRAAVKLEDQLAKTSFSSIDVPLVANVDAKSHTEAADIQSGLAKQLYSPVLWEQGVRTMLDMGVDTFIELGPGTVLSGLVKKVERRIQTMHVEDEATLRAVIEAVQLA
jgi:[acyl-carrier-protein] S-malonyltransferase